MNRKIVIGHLYPSLLNLYGDSGNIASLTKRCQWRGIDVEVKNIEAEDEMDIQNVDILLLGGGSDREEKIVCNALREKQDALKEYVEDGGVLLAVCGGFQMLGSSYQTAEDTMEGLGILDIKTVYEPDRLMGNVVLKSTLTDMPVVGFENHNGRMDIGTHQPLGSLICGKGSDGKGKTEGIVYKHVIGTYLYGPLLPKNPELCDWLIQSALKRKYGVSKLSDLDDEMEEGANAYIVKRFTQKENN